MCTIRAKMVPRPQEVFCGKWRVGRQIKIFATFLFLVKTPCAPRAMWRRSIQNSGFTIQNEKGKERRNLDAGLTQIFTAEKEDLLGRPYGGFVGLMAKSGMNFCSSDFRLFHPRHLSYAIEMGNEFLLIGEWQKRYVLAVIIGEEARLRFAGARTRLRMKEKKRE